MTVHEAPTTIAQYANEWARFVITLCRLCSQHADPIFQKLSEAGVEFQLKDKALRRLNELAEWSRRTFGARGSASQEAINEGRELLQNLMARLISGGLVSDHWATSIKAYVGLVAMTPTGWKEPRHMTPVLAKLKYMVRATVLQHIMKAESDPKQ
jgi:hypothetical protein